MAKNKYVLLHNEATILKNEMVLRGNQSGELWLTNLNLVWITSKGVFKTTYIANVYPLDQN